jgi:catecholate siderophore receptor
MAYPANAQEAPTPAPLPPLNVETTAKKKAPAKKAAAKKKSATSPTPQPPSDADSVGATTGGTGTAEPGANPYANPNAPYMVERSASTKLTEPLVNTPRTITAVPKEVLEDKGVTSVRELARQTPGVTIGSGEGGNAFSDALFIRGYSARNDIFVDGIRDPGNVPREAFAIEQVEIYKGPSGVLSGRGTPGGAINLITKKPDMDASFYESSTTIGTDSTFREALDLNQVVTPDFAVRANLLYHQNEIAGRDFTEDERWGGLISATATPTDDLKITLDYYRLRTDGIPDWGVPVSRDQKVPFTELGVDRSNWYGDLDRDFMKNDSDIGTATIEAKLTDNITLTNVTRIGTNTTDYVASTPRPTDGQPDANGEIGVRNAQRYQTTDLFSNHTDVNIKFNMGSWEHTVVAGVEYSRDEIGRYNYQFNVEPPILVSLFNPNPHRSGFVTGRTLLYDATVDTLGAYIGDTVKLSEQWIVNAGIRIDDFERDQVGGTAANTANRKDTLVNWHTGIVYKPIPIASIYAAYATAESPIGGELDSTGLVYSGLSAATLGTEPEETTGIEVGTKWELFDRRLLATAALFQTTKDKQRTNGSVDPTGSGNAGESRVRGIELGAAGNLTDEWSVFGGVVFMQTEVLKSDNPAEIGRRLANIPLTQFALLSTYDLTDRLTVGGQAIYGSEIYSGHHAANDNGYHTTEYWRFDAFAEYKLTQHLSVEIQGVNLTDELYYDAMYQAHDTFAFVAPGRAGYATVRWKY